MDDSIRSILQRIEETQLFGISEEFTQPPSTVADFPAFRMGATAAHVMEEPVSPFTPGSDEAWLYGLGFHMERAWLLRQGDLWT